MPKGPQGQKRPADAIGLAVMVGRIATGEVEDTTPIDEKKRAAGIKGGPARAAIADPQTRREIAQKAASARWAKTRS